MSVSIKHVKNIFNYIRTGDNYKFFGYVAADVLWRVMGTHPLAENYKSKEDFIVYTFGRLDKLLKEGVILKVNNIIVQNDTAVVEMESLSTALNDKPFNNTYCWVCRFNNVIIDVWDVPP